MNNFLFETGTKIFFGGGCVQEYLASFLAGYGPNVLLVTDGGDRHSPAAEQVRAILGRAGKETAECAVGPLCPQYEQVQRAARLCREHQADLILGVGGSAVLDGCKAAALGAVCRGDLWENFWACQGVVDIPPLPVGFVASHLEAGAVNGAAGMVHENQCVWRDYSPCDPSFALLDPAYPAALSRNELTAQGFSALAGALETYLLQTEGMGVPCRLLETLMAGMVRGLGKLQRGRLDEEAHSNLMWSCALWGSRFFQLGRKAAFPSLPVREAALLAAEGDREKFVRELAARLPALLRRSAATHLELAGRLAESLWALPTRDRTVEGCLTALERFLDKLGFSQNQKVYTA